jgi:hypothetical protein
LIVISVVRVTLLRAVQRPYDRFSDCVVPGTDLSRVVMLSLLQANVLPTTEHSSSVGLDRSPHLQKFIGNILWH